MYASWHVQEPKSLSCVFVFPNPTCSLAQTLLIHQCSRKIGPWTAARQPQQRWTWRACRRSRCSAHSSANWPRSQTQPANHQWRHCQTHICYIHRLAYHWLQREWDLLTWTIVVTINNHSGDWLISIQPIITLVKVDAPYFRQSTLEGVLERLKKGLSKCICHNSSLKKNHFALFTLTCVIWSNSDCLNNDVVIIIFKKTAI